MQSNSQDQYVSYVETKSTDDSNVIIGANLCQETSDPIDIEAQNIEMMSEEEPVTQSETTEENRKAKLTGHVVECQKLNVREAPNPTAAVLAVIPARSEVMIEIDASTEEFYKVCTAAGIQGFCKRDYIEL